MLDLFKKLDQKFEKVNSRDYIFTNTSYRLHIYNAIVKVLHVITYKTEYNQLELL